VLAWIVAMGAKTTAIVAPGAYLLDQVIVTTPGGSGRGALARRTARALLLAAPLLALGTWSAAITFRSLASSPLGGAGFEATSLGPGAYFLTQLRVTWLYLRLVAWPDALAFDRWFRPGNGVDGATIAAAAGWLLVIGLAALLWLRAERADGPRPAARLAAFGILFWFVALSPTSSFVPVLDLAVEHRVYLAILGPLLAATVGIDALVHRVLPHPRANAAGAVMGIVALLALGVVLRGRATDYASAEALWRGAAAASPENPRTWTNLGLALQRRGDLAGAEAAYARAWAVVRDPSRIASLARNHGALLTESNRPAEALAVIERGIAAAPGDPALHANRAAALARLGRDAEAQREARRAVELGPGNPLMRHLLGQTLLVYGDAAGALAEFLAAEALDPGPGTYPVYAGIALARLGRRDEACAAFGRGLARPGPRALLSEGARVATSLGCPVPVR
jgi:Flp pilus assembly protein TadD